jgi:hypothetical protein
LGCAAAISTNADTAWTYGEKMAAANDGRVFDWNGHDRNCMSVMDLRFR